jgi:hypothetical protein
MMQLPIQLSDAFQGVFLLAVIAQPLLDENFLFGGPADRFGAASGGS